MKNIFVSLILNMALFFACDSARSGGGGGSDPATSTKGGTKDALTGTETSGTLGTKSSSAQDPVTPGTVGGSTTGGSTTGGSTTGGSTTGTSTTGDTKNEDFSIENKDDSASRRPVFVVNDGDLLSPADVGQHVFSKKRPQKLSITIANTCHLEIRISPPVLEIYTEIANAYLKDPFANSDADIWGLSPTQGSILVGTSSALSAYVSEANIADCIAALSNGLSYPIGRIKSTGSQFEVNSVGEYTPFQGEWLELLPELDRNTLRGQPISVKYDASLDIIRVVDAIDSSVITSSVFRLNIGSRRHVKLTGNTQWIINP